MDSFCSAVLEGGWLLNFRWGPGYLTLDALPKFKSTSETIYWYIIYLYCQQYNCHIVKISTFLPLEKRNNIKIEPEGFDLPRSKANKNCWWRRRMRRRSRRRSRRRRRRKRRRRRGQCSSLANQNESCQRLAIGSGGFVLLSIAEIRFKKCGMYWVRHCFGQKQWLLITSCDVILDPNW